MSGAAATLLAVSLSSSGIVDIQLATITIYGVNFGAAVTTWLFSWGVSGNSRKITRYQVLFDVLGTMILVPLFSSGKRDRCSFGPDTGNHAH